MINERKAHNSRALKWLSKASATISVTAEDVYMLREAILNSAPKYASDELYNSGKRIYASLILSLFLAILSYSCAPAKKHIGSFK